MLIIDMPMPVKEWNCLDCKVLCVDMFRHYCGITKKTIDTLKNMRARPDWCPIKGEVEYARMVHERIMDEIKDNVSLKRLEEELFVLCKEKEDADC